MSKRETGLATSLLRLAQTYLDVGDFAKAEPLLEETQRVLAMGSSPSLAEAVVLDCLGVAYRRIGRRILTVRYATRAADVARQAVGERHPVYAKILQNLGAGLRVAGSYAEAEPALRRSLEITESLVPSSPSDVSACQFSLGLLYTDIRDYEAARPLLQQAVDLIGATRGEETFEFAVAVNALAVNRQVAGDYAAAARFFRQVTTTYQRTVGENHPNYAGSLRNLSGLYQAMGLYGKAEQLLLQASQLQFATIGPNHPDSLATLNQLAVVSFHRGAYATADSLLQTAAEGTRAVFGEESAEHAAALHNLAMLRHSQDDNHAAAEQLLDRVVKIERQALGERHPSCSDSLLNLGQVCHAQGKYDDAETHYRQAAEIQRGIQGRPRPGLARSLNALADLYAATERPAEAFALMQEANEMDHYLTGQVFSIGSETQRMEYLASLLSNLYTFLSLVANSLSDSPEAVAAALDLVLQRKAIGAEALAVQRDAVLSGRYPHLQAKIRELRLLRAQICEKELAGPREGMSEDHQHDLLEWKARRERLEAELAGEIPEMNLARQIKTADHRTVAAALPRDAVLVEFVYFQEFDFAKGGSHWKSPRYLAFVLLAGESRGIAMLDLGDAWSINHMIADFRTGFSNDLGQSLRARIFDPLLSSLGGATRLFLAPDGELAKLPFEVLPDDDGSHLIDHYEISYIGVGRDILRFGHPDEERGGEALVIADPDFDLRLEVDQEAAPDDDELIGRRARERDRAGMMFARLPGTRSEGKDIAKRLGVDPLLGAQALEGRLKAARSPRVLHIATHGFFLPDQQIYLTAGTPGPSLEKPSAAGSGPARPFGQRIENPLLRSGLALAGANSWGRAALPSEAEDGILTAEDVSGLDLSGTELVVLSACETGLGDVWNGEGVFGLRRVFALAGAKTLVTSLWTVPDTQTAELMAEFYRRVQVGESRVNALRQAQLLIRDGCSSVESWGAFVCYGDPGPLRCRLSEG